MQSTQARFQQRVLLPSPKDRELLSETQLLIPDLDAQEAGDTTHPLSGGLALQRTDSQADEEPSRLPGCGGEIIHSSWASHKTPFFSLLLERSIKRKAGVHSRKPIISAQDSRDGINHRVPGDGMGEGRHQFPCLCLDLQRSPTFGGAEWKM